MVMHNILDDSSDKLTLKQKLFVRHYIENGFNGTQAAISAGYSEDTARSIATENLAKPLIKKYLEEKLEEKSIASDISQEWVLRRLAKCAEVSVDVKSTDANALKNHKALLGATDQINKMKGYYAPVKSESTNKHEVEGDLKDLVNKYQKDY